MLPIHVTLSLAAIHSLLSPMWRCERCGVQLHDRARQRCNCEVRR
jgi:hypothetical protein